MTFEEYSAIDALNWSTLKDVDPPLLCKWRETHPKKDTKELRFGRKIHLAILQPKLFDELCISSPFDSFRTKKAREWRDEQISAGREIITDEDLEIIRIIQDRIEDRTLTDAADVLAGTRKEETITWVIDGIKRKARIDFIAHDRIGDLKTCRDLKRFLRDAAELAYHGQIASYRDGAIRIGACSRDAQAYWIVAETNEPYDVACLKIGQQTLDAGLAYYEHLIEVWRACRAEELWYGRYPGTVMVDLPSWAPGMRPEGEEDF